MELFERYLQAVKKHLPSGRQDDIIAELRANLESQLEDRQAELGRPLTEGEMVDWLKVLGHPASMAARYQPPQYLIGPETFGMYRTVLGLALTWGSVAYLISVVARTLIESRSPAWLGLQVAQFPFIWLQIAAWVTFSFAVIEAVWKRYPETRLPVFGGSSNWSPSSLPPLEKNRPVGGKPRTWATAVAEFWVQLALIVWLLPIPANPYLLLGPGAAYLEHSAIRLTHISVVFYWAVVAFNMVQCAWHGYKLVTGNWRMRSTAQKLVTKLLGAVPLAILLFAPNRIYLELNPPEASRLPAGLDLAVWNHYLFSTVMVLVCITIFQLAWDVWKASTKARGRNVAAVL